MYASSTLTLHDVDSLDIVRHPPVERPDGSSCQWTDFTFRMKDGSTVTVAAFHDVGAEL